ncbi:MAG: hypothetical protein ACLFP4_16695 [Spirochaetales bacterium]
MQLQRQRSGCRCRDERLGREEEISSDEREQDNETKNSLLQY